MEGVQSFDSVNYLKDNVIRWEIERTDLSRDTIHYFKDELTYEE